MNNLFRSADLYLKASDWKTLALIKFCLCSIGMLIALAVPQRARKPLFVGAVAVFVATYIPLMAKYFGIVREMVTLPEQE